MAKTYDIETLLRENRDQRRSTLVIFVDMDCLKKANDVFGHDMGDQILRSFADLLCRNTRQGDILCRYGGDEFMVILKHLSDVETVMKKGTDICRAFHDRFAQEQLPASCSGGIALCGEDEKPSAELIKRADQALYRAKRENKGGCCLWSDGIESNRNK